MSRAARSSKTRRSSALFFRRTILRWFASHGRDLPWRRTRDPWRILVSEIMLQQTQVDRVIPKYEAFLAKWPTPATFADSSLGDALSTWSGLGYNRRCRHLHLAAKEIVARHGGATPTDVEALLALPGIGPYTARAVASFSANADVVLWDTNVRRIVLRHFFRGEFAGRTPDDAELHAALEAAFPEGRSRDWHNALMDFGSAVCTGRSPSCAACPLRRTCLAAPKFLGGHAAKVRLVKPQARFEGSRRQARGAILRALAAAGKKGAALKELQAGLRDHDAGVLMEALVKEGMAVRKGAKAYLP